MSFTRASQLPSFVLFKTNIISKWWFCIAFSAKRRLFVGLSQLGYRILNAQKVYSPAPPIQSSKHDKGLKDWNNGAQERRLAREIKWSSYEEVYTCVIVNVYVRVCTCTSCMSACLPACQSVYLPVCTVLWRPGRRIEDSGRGKKCCQSVLDEHWADGSRREDGWRAGAMHYSGIIQTEPDHWGKTATHIFMHVNNTHICAHTHENTPGQRVVFSNKKLLQQVQTKSCERLAFHIYRLNNHDYHLCGKTASILNTDAV